MATANKKKGKKQKVYLNDMLQEEQQPNTIKMVFDWSEEMENKKLDSTLTYGSVTVDTIVLPKAPRSSFDVEDLNQIPENPPYTAQLKNLPYDYTPEQIAQFLSKLMIKEIKPPRDKGKPSGIAYVEFERREDLIEAIKKSEEKLMGRPIQIQVATSTERRPYNSNVVNDGNSWRSNSSQVSTGRDPYRRGSYRDDYSNTGPNRFPSYDNSGGRRMYAGSASTEYFSKNRNQPQYGNNRMGDSSFPPNPMRHQSNDKPDGAFNNFPRFHNSALGQQAPPQHQQQPSRASVPLETGMARLELTNSEGLPLKPGPPAERVKLDLKPRSADKKVPDSQEAPPPAQVKGRSYAAIFGGAKPVDTSSVERAIEEKLLKQQQPPPLAPPKSGPGGANNKERVIAGEKIISRSASLASFGQASDDGLTPASFGPRPGAGPDFNNHRRSSGGSGHHILPQPTPQGASLPPTNIYASASSLTSPLKPPHDIAHPANGPPAPGMPYNRQQPPYQQHYPSHPDNQQQYGQGGGPGGNYRGYSRDSHPTYPPGMPPMAPNDHYATAPRQHGKPPGGMHRPYQGAKSMDYHRGGGHYMPGGVPPMPPNAARQGGGGARYPNQPPPHQAYMGGGERRQSADTRNYDYQQRNPSNKRQPRAPSNNAPPYYSSRPNSRPGGGGGYGPNEGGGYGQYATAAAGATGNQRSSMMMMGQEATEDSSDQSPYLSVAKATAAAYDHRATEESTTPSNNGLIYRNKYETLHNLEDE